MSAFQWSEAPARALRAGLAMLLFACSGDNPTSTATATAPAITTQPASASVAVGGNASFSVVATGSAPLTYQWRKGGSAISGASSATYGLSSVTAGDAGQYDVVVSNSAGSVTSSAAALTVTGGTAAPQITTQPASQSVAAGASVTFTVAATGTAPLTYQWRRNGAAITGATAVSYTIASVATTDAGTFDVVVSNSGGSSTSAAATLTVTTASGGSALSAQATTAAQAFLATLSTSQQTTARIDFSVTNARRWSNLPAALSGRNGINWGSLSASQQTAARTLITTALSTAGNTLHVGMQAADDYLNAVGGGPSYGAGQYYIVILGTPSATNFWMLQLTGHHLTFNLSFNGSYKSPTPLFLGVEPRGSFTQGGVTYDPMGAQRNAMGSLGAALLAYPGAKLNGTYSDLLFGANASGGIDNTCPRAYGTVAERGLLYSALSTADQALVQAVIGAYVNTQASEYANELLSNYLSSTSLAATYVAYTGSGNVTGNGNYFRIDGPRLWIEFSVQRGIIIGNDVHYHTIWRDKLGDYGGACL